MLGRFTDEAVEIMAACETGQNRIRRGIPKEQILVHKTGTMRGVVNDAGVVVLASGSYCLAVLMNDISIGSPGSYVAQGEKIIADISAKVWKAQKGMPTRPGRRDAP